MKKKNKTLVPVLIFVVPIFANTSFDLLYPPYKLVLMVRKVTLVKNITEKEKKSETKYFYLEGLPY